MAYKTALITAFAGAAAARGVTKISDHSARNLPMVQCNRETNPDPEVCTAIMEDEGWFDDKDLKESRPDNDDECWVYQGEKGENCEIWLCWEDEDFEEDLHLFTVANLDYDLLEARCLEKNAGGWVRGTLGGDYTLEVKPNTGQQFDGGSEKKRSATKRSPGKHSAPQESTHQRRDDDEEKAGFDPYTLPDFNIFEDSANMKKPGTGMKVAGPEPAGSTYTLQESETTTETISMGAGIDASVASFFGVSLEASVSESKSFSTTEGKSVNIDCESGQDGMIYFYPMFRYVQGNKDKEEVELWIPMPAAGGRYEVECIHRGSNPENKRRAVQF